MSANCATIACFSPYSNIHRDAFFQLVCVKSVGIASLSVPIVIGIIKGAVWLVVDMIASLHSLCKGWWYDSVRNRGCFIVTINVASDLSNPQCVCVKEIIVKEIVE